jgi:membrane glycosyltransferase
LCVAQTRWASSFNIPEPDDPTKVTEFKKHQKIVQQRFVTRKRRLLLLLLLLAMAVVAVLDVRLLILHTFQ